jgi:lipopolysaccharide transport system ATP-binding protein
VSFEVQPGEVLGIIGRNGAGKSTLLKILSRITEPTSGEITMRGRVASLLEVGTGFHPELSGRDNIYLNGAILGMTKAEIRSKFDEIVAFAEIEKFIDTPVKRYSSGMYVRLAFAVAAHLEPEILIVDEVLAVGDQQFQDKCIGKMQEVSRGGRTVLFVSHNMAAVQRLCSRAVLMASGKVESRGEVDYVLGQYLEMTQVTTIACADLNSAKVHRHGSGLARFHSFSLKNEDGQLLSILPLGAPFYVELVIHAETRIHNALFGFSFIAKDGVEIMGSAAHDGGLSTTLPEGAQAYRCLISPNILLPGRYTLRGAIFSQGEVHDHIDSILGFEVSEVRSNKSDAPSSHKVGYVYCPYQWSAIPLNK